VVTGGAAAGREPGRPDMPLPPSFLLRNKTLMAAVAVAGILIAVGAVVAVPLRPAARIAAIRLDSRAAAAAYARGDRPFPYVPVLTAPAGHQVTSPAVAAAAGRAFAAMAAALPGVRIADYATTHDRAFITRRAPHVCPAVHGGRSQLRRRRLRAGHHLRADGGGAARLAGPPRSAAVPGGHPGVSRITA
jgi:hypothetical protein